MRLNKNKKLLWYVIGGFLILVGFTISILYFKFGLREYLDVLSSIDKMDSSLRSKARNEFFSISSDLPYEQYGGIIAYVNTSDKPGVAIWGKDGLKYFKAYQDTVYSFFELCTDENIEAIRFYQSYTILPQITTNISEWNKRAYVGRSVAIEIADGKYKGYIREAKSSDWYQFLPAKPYLLCIEK